jgi:hypothetical protein
MKPDKTRCRFKKYLTVAGRENSHIRILNFYAIFIPLFEGKVSGVSVQEMPLCLLSLLPAAL